MWRGNKREIESKSHSLFFPDNIISQRPSGEGDLQGVRDEGPTLPACQEDVQDLIPTGSNRLRLASRLYDTSGGVLR